MTYETTKATYRRLHDIRYGLKYFVGKGIDIGAGNDSLGKFMQQFTAIQSVTPWDVQDGDAQRMEGVEDNSYDFVHSSHCLEHLYDPYEAFKNWIRICRPGGHLIVCIPDEDLYEQGVWPSQFALDHKTSWTILKESSWGGSSINLIEFLYRFRDKIEILKIELCNQMFNYVSPRVDQTHYTSECAIEFVVRKKTAEEIQRKGHFPF